MRGKAQIMEKCAPPARDPSNAITVPKLISSILGLFITKMTLCWSLEIPLDGERYTRPRVSADSLDRFTVGDLYFCEIKPVP